MSEVPIGCLAQRAEMVRRGLEKMLLSVLRLGMVVTSESREVRRLMPVVISYGFARFPALLKGTRSE